MSLAESFGDVLRRYRLSRHLTQEALAEQAALSPTAIAALERGRNRSPRFSTLRQLARALGLEPEELAELARLSGAGGGAQGRPAAPGTGEGYGATPDVTEPAPTLVAPGEARHRAPEGLAARPAGTVAPPAIVARRWRVGFVGRQAELARLLDACRGGCRLVELLGEPGIGKTRLVAQLVAALHDEGLAVLWGRCAEETLGSYAPFVEALRQLVASADVTALRAAVGQRGDLQRLVPGLEERIGPLPAATRADAGTEQRLLFEAVEDLLAPWTPLVVVLDDLHWADEASMSLLGYLARSVRLQHLTLLCMARPADLGEARSGLLSDLGRQVEHARLRLGGLERPALAGLVADLIGATPAEALVSSVEEATEGNPFFSEEMTVQLVDSGLLRLTEAGVVVAQDPGSQGVPERVRETLARRLLSLSPDATELLSYGSILGREFDLSTAAASSGLERLRLVDAADDGIMSGLVGETAAGRLLFSHALVQQAVRDRLSGPRRAEMHRRVAEVLQHEWPERPTVATDLARHWAVVAEADASSATTAATWAVRAGDLALQTAAADDAIARYEAAASLWGDSTLGHADALVRLGAALRHRGRADEADLRFRQALHLAVALGAGELQARAAIGLGQRYPYWETDSDRIDALEGALAALPPGGGLLRFTLMGLLVTQLINGFHPEEAERRDALAAELAGTATDPEASPEVLQAIGQTRVYDCIEDPVALRGVARRLVGVAEATSDLRVLAGARFAEALAALDTADMGSLREATERYGAIAEQLDDPGERSQAATVRSTIAFVEGRYDEADALSAEALEHGKASGDFNAELLFYAQGLLRAVDRGQASDVLPLLLDASDYGRIPAFAAGTVLCAALAGEHDLALERLEGLVRSGFEAKPRGADWLSSMAFLAHSCCILGARGAARHLYAALVRQPVRIVRVGPLAGWWGPVDHHLGGLALLLGDADGAEAHLTTALRTEEAMGARPFAARTGAALAALLAVRRPLEAKSLTDRARSVAASLGAAGIVAEVESALADGS